MNKKKSLPQFHRLKRISANETNIIHDTSYECSCRSIDGQAENKKI